MSQEQLRRRAFEDRRRLGHPVDGADDPGAESLAHTNRHSFSKIAIKGAVEAIPKVETPLTHRGPHSRHLTLRLSCGARAPQRLRHRPPARRLLQPFVRRRPTYFGRRWIATRMHFMRSGGPVRLPT